MSGIFPSRGPGDLAAPAEPLPLFEAECERLRALLAEQVEADSFREGRETAVALLCLCPDDGDAVRARDFLDEQLAAAAAAPLAEVGRFDGHTGSVNAVAFSPAGGWVASGSGGATAGRADEQTIRLWDLASGREIRRLEGFSGAVTGLAVSSGGDRILSSHRGGGMDLWDAAGGQLLRRFERRASNLGGVALSVCGRWALSGGDDRLVRLWNAGTGKRIHRLAGHTAAVNCVAIAADGRRALSGGADATARLWDLVVGRELAHLPGCLPVLAVAFSPGGRTALMAGADGIIVWWDLDSGRVLVRLTGHSAGVRAVAFCPDGCRAVSAGADGTVRLWDVPAGRELRSFSGHVGSVEAVAVSPADGLRALSGGRDGSVRLWQLPAVVLRASSADNLPRLGETAWGSTLELAQALARSPLLELSQKEELASLRRRLRDPAALLLDLAERGWLTPFQVGRLADGPPEGLVLGSYVVLDRLGEGANGEVFKARPVGSRLTVVIKMLRPELTADPEAVRHFVAEIQVLSRLAHPHVIRTFGAGQAGGRHFFAMEHLEGTDLGRLVQRSGPLPVGAACEYMRQAALGLEHAHERCLIHRDIKPANILLTVPAGAEGGPAAVVKIIDWGLATLRPPGREVTGRARGPGDLVGTADYVAPEQIGDTAVAGIQADVYSLGCTLYHLLVGQPPFPGGSLYQKLMSHRTANPRPLRATRRDVPEALVAVVRKMMAKQPSDRYSTPAAAAAALAPFCTAPIHRASGRATASGCETVAR